MIEGGVFAIISAAVIGTLFLLVVFVPRLKLIGHQWTLTCPFCGTAYNETSQSTMKHLDAEITDISCTVCKASLLDLWLASPNVQRILKERRDRLSSLATAKIQLEVFLESEKDLKKATEKT